MKIGVWVRLQKWEGEEQGAQAPRLVMWAVKNGRIRPLQNLSEVEDP